MVGEAAAISRTLINSTWAFRTGGETRTARPRQKATAARAEKTASGGSETQDFQAMDRFLSREPSCLDPSGSEDGSLQRSSFDSTPVPERFERVQFAARTVAIVMGRS